MNQEKIGKFIRELRCEKKLTQQELADKLGVSDKAISKWENGRCLMDLSLLKPLSDALDVSVIEMLSGERVVDSNIGSKSEEVVKNTLDYSNELIKKNKKRVVFNVIKILFVLFLAVFIGYRIFNYYKYSTVKYEDIKINENFDFSKNYKVYKKSLNEHEYISFRNVKFKNIIDGLILDEQVSIDNINNYIVRFNDINGNFVFSFSTHTDYLEVFKKDGGVFDNFGNIYYYDSTKFILENDINDFVDLYTYFYNNGFKKNTIFTSVDDMKFNLLYNFKFETYEYDKYTFKNLISGDYKGIIYDNVSENTFVVKLVKDNVQYNFNFSRNVYSINEVLDIISTLEIR